MKFRKILLLLVLPLITSCNFSTMGGSNNTSDNENEEEKQTDWLDEEKQIFENNLYGYIPTYNVFKGNKVEFDTKNNAICVSGVNSSHEYLESCTNSLVEDGFILESNENNYYSLHKIYEEESIEKYCYVDMGGLDNNGKLTSDGTGTFCMYIFDPYDYSWPTDEAKIAVETLTNKSGTILPKYENVLTTYFIADSYQTTGYIYIYVDTFDSDPVGEYKKALEKAGYEVFDGVAYSQKGDLIVYFEIDETGLFLISFRECIRNWPGDEINSQIRRFYPTSTTTIPKLDGSEYRISNAANYRSVIVYAYDCDFSSFENYVSGLENFGWEIKENLNVKDGFCCIPSTEDFELQVNYEEGKPTQLVVLPYFKPSTNWPEKLISGLVDRMLATGTVPAYSGAVSSYVVQEDIMYNGILCYVSVGSEQNHVDSYCEQLETLGYEMVGLDLFGCAQYCYPGTSLIITPQFNTAGTFTIDLARKAFDKDKIPFDAFELFLKVVGKPVVFGDPIVITDFEEMIGINYNFDQSTDDGIFLQCFVKLDEKNNSSIKNELYDIFEKTGFLEKTNAEVYYGPTEIALEKDNVRITLYTGYNENRESNELVIDFTDISESTI